MNTANSCMQKTPGAHCLRARLLTPIIGLLVVLSATLGGAPAATAQTKVILGTAKDPNLGSQFVIAREKGFFKEAGLEADIRYFPSGGDLATAFVGGSVQMGSSGATPVTLLRARPYPIVIVARISDNSGAQQLIVRQNVKTLDDLVGKKIAVMRGTGSEALFNSIVKSYGFDPTKAELINMAPAEMVQAFVRGNVDAITIWEPNGTLARKAGNGKVLISATRSYIAGKEGPNRIHGEQAVLYTSQAFLKEQPATVRAVLVALLKANEFIEANRTEATAILAKEFGLEPADMASVLSANRYTLSLDDEMAADLNKLSDFLVTLKRLPAPVKAADWIDPAPLRALRADQVKLK
jgi:ABC-type nitrate/sulfonate/bicarbonate transport system substrate-binding protein